MPRLNRLPFTTQNTISSTKYLSQNSKFNFVFGVKSGTQALNRTKK